MISAQRLTKYYGDTCAIRDLTFDIDKGEIVGILGLNGAGKTTTLRILASLLLPSAGKVQINGLDVVENPQQARKLVGFLPDTPPLYTEMTVESMLTFVAQLRGLERAQLKKRLDDVLQLTSAAEVRKKVIATLSHGYRQRVGLAQAIIHDPPVLVLDEPISGLDPVQIVEVREMIRGLKGQHTLLISSHILSEISQTCDRILLLNEGEIVASGTEEELTASLASGQRLHVAVRGERDKVLGVVRDLDGVVGCSINPDPHPYRTPAAEKDIVQLEVTTNSEVREAISNAVIGAGFGLLHLSPAEGKLESAFLKLTKRAGAKKPAGKEKAA